MINHLFQKGYKYRSNCFTQFLLKLRIGRCSQLHINLLFLCCFRAQRISNSWETVCKGCFLNLKDTKNQMSTLKQWLKSWNQMIDTCQLLDLNSKLLKFQQICLFQFCIKDIALDFICKWHFKLTEFLKIHKIANLFIALSEAILWYFLDYLS